MTTKKRDKVFDYRALRLLIGLIAFSIPFVVSFLSSSSLSSISASYHTEARDAFVGMLFIVSAFLWAYNGHSLKEALASKAASLAALFVAIFPTSCDHCETNIVSITHYVAAVIFFSILAYFCFVSFRQHIKGLKGKKGLRSKIYFVCGLIMVGCMLIIFVQEFILPDETMKSLNVTFWAEAIALGAFGVAWIVAGKYFSLIVDKDEALQLFG